MRIANFPYDRVSAGFIRLSMLSLYFRSFLIFDLFPTFSISYYVHFRVNPMLFVQILKFFIVSSTRIALNI